MHALIEWPADISLDHYSETFKDVVKVFIIVLYVKSYVQFKKNMFVLLDKDLLSFRGCEIINFLRFINRGLDT